MAPNVSRPKACHCSLVRPLPKQRKKNMAVVTVFRFPSAMKEIGDSCWSARKTMLLMSI